MGGLTQPRLPYPSQRNNKHPGPQASTNTKLPVSCAAATIGDDFDPDNTRDCITTWISDVVPTAAYSVGSGKLYIEDVCTFSWPCVHTGSVSLA